MAGKTTQWKKTTRRIRGVERDCEVRLFNGNEQIRLLDIDRARPNELDTQIPYKTARRIYRRNVKNAELDNAHRAQITYPRPNKRWAKDVSHYDVEQIDAPK